MTTLAKFLTSAGVTQHEFAQNLGVTQATISRLARRKKTPGLRLAVAIEAATGGAVPAASWTTPANDEAEG